MLHIQEHRNRRLPIPVPLNFDSPQTSALGSLSCPLKSPLVDDEILASRQSGVYLSHDVTPYPWHSESCFGLGMLWLPQDGASGTYGGRCCPAPCEVNLPLAQTVMCSKQDSGDGVTDDFQKPGKWADPAHLKDRSL